MKGVTLRLPGLVGSDNDGVNRMTEGETRSHPSGLSEWFSDTLEGAK